MPDDDSLNLQTKLFTVNKFIQYVIRYKVLHVIYWIWVIISFLHFHQEHHGGNILSQIPMAVIIYSFQMTMVYSLLYFLIPRFLNKQKYFLFVALTFAFVIAASAFSSLAVEIYYYIVNPKPFNDFVIMTISLAVDMVIVVLIFLSADIIYSRYKNEQHNRQVEKEKLETELNFLKSQLNPHFLFNALNSIYVLMKEDIKLSEQTLLRFSSLLRYQLYDCNNHQTTLENEIEFLKNYISLEQVRNGENLKVNFTISEKMTFFQMAPFILIPFVENAFKHVSHFTDKPNSIEIKMSNTSNTFHFAVDNTYDESLLPQSNANNGIGLQNVKRRLELLYPEKHSLQLSKKENIYSATLTLRLNGN